jgi:hypothetical protein
MSGWHRVAVYLGLASENKGEREARIQRPWYLQPVDSTPLMALGFLMLVVPVIFGLRGTAWSAVVVAGAVVVVASAVVGLLRNRRAEYQRRSATDS